MSTYSANLLSCIIYLLISLKWISSAEHVDKSEAEMSLEGKAKKREDLRDANCLQYSPQSKSIMATLLQDYDKDSPPSNGSLDVQAEVALVCPVKKLSRHL